MNAETPSISDTPKGRLYAANKQGYSNGLTGDSVTTYAVAFQFGAWLTRKFGGIEFVKALATNAAVDFDSILKAVESCGYHDYTIERLLIEYTEDLLVRESGIGLNQDAPTYFGSTELTYTKESYSSSPYLYEFTAIDLWNSFYAWVNSNKDNDNYFLNEETSYASLPAGNLYKKQLGSPLPANYGKTFKGPALLRGGNVRVDVGPYTYFLNCVGTADSDLCEVVFDADEKFRDVLTIVVK